MTSTGTKELEGVTVPASRMDAYAVSADGTLSLDGGALLGAVCAEGRVAFLAQETARTSHPVVIRLVRK